MFKVGDKIVRKKEHIIQDTFHAYDGTVAAVICDDGDNVRYTFGDFQHSSGFSDRFELYEEKEMFDMLTQPWFIKVTQETFPAVNQWLKENYKGDHLPISYLPDRSTYLTNTTYSGSVEKRIMHGYTNKNLGKEIVLDVEYRVTNAVFPVVETEAQKKLKELEEQQRKIADTIAKIRESL